MGKLQKALKHNRILSLRLDSLTGVLAYLTNKSGGELKITKGDLDSMPEGKFIVDVKDDTFIFTLQKIVPKEEALQE